MRILVTGGAGYIGSVLVPLLLDKGFRVTVLDNFLYKQNSLISECWRENLEIVRGDCRDEETMKPLVAKVDIIVPLAAIVGMPACAANKTAAATTNLHAIALLCSLASKSQMILYPTTNSGYGLGSDEPCTEESPLNPVSLYGSLKRDAEAEVLKGENTASFRFATLFGMSPRMRTDLLLNNFVYRAMRDRYVVLYQAHFRRNFLHVRDAASAFLWAIDHFDEMRGRPYNVGLPDANLTKWELCERIKRHVPDFYFAEASVGEDPDKRNYICDNSRILSTGWRPRYSLDEGIKELIRGYEILRGFNPYANA